MKTEDKIYKKFKNVIKIESEGIYHKSFGIKSTKTRLTKPMYKRLFR